MESVGERLKRIRKENNYTQEELAQKLGLEPPAVSKYETDRVQIPQEYIIKICDIFNISCDYLLGRTNIQNAIDEPIAIAASTKNGIDLSEIDDEEDRKTILNIFNTYKNKGKTN